MAMMGSAKGSINKMEALIDVSVKIPTARLAEFYAMYGAWLEAPPADTDTRAHAEWSAADIALAKQVWGKLSEQARLLFELLMSDPGTKHNGTEIAKALGLAHGRFGTAGTLAWPGRHSYAVGRTHPVRFEETDGDSLYWMDRDVAALFKKASK